MKPDAQSPSARYLENIESQYLVLGALSGDKSALNDLITLWTPKLLGYCSRFHHNSEDCEDLVQEIWMTAIKTLRRLEDPARFPPWIYRIAHHKSVDRLRKQIRDREKQHNLEANPPETSLSPTQQSRLQTEQENQQLAQLIDTLKPEFREVLILHYHEEFDLQSIATILDIPKNTVKSRLFHARKQLEKKLHFNH